MPKPRARRDPRPMENTGRGCGTSELPASNRLWQLGGIANTVFSFSCARARAAQRRPVKYAARLKNFWPPLAERGVGFRSRIYACRATTHWSHARIFFPLYENGVRTISSPKSLILL